MNLIVAADRNWGIGKDGDQLVYIPQDLKHFRALTMGHPVVLGRKTLATFPGGRPLKGRRNLILSRDPDFAPEGAEVYASLEDLIPNLPEDAFVIGGASVYEQLLPLCDTAYVTRLETEFPADRFFPNLDLDLNWRLTDISEAMEHEGIRFQFLTYRRVS